MQSEQSRRIFDANLADKLVAAVRSLPEAEQAASAKAYIDILQSSGIPTPVTPSTGDNKDGSVFGDASAPRRRYIPDFSVLASHIKTLKQLGTRVVLVSGTFDMFHIGHARYLDAARRYGDFLVVGIDSDAKVKQRKGPNRPLVPENERLELLCHIRGVGFVTVKTPEHPKWELIRAVRPDTLIATEETYSQSEINELENNYCGRVVKLPRQAETSTSARIRHFQMNANGDVARKALQALQEVLGPLVEGGDVGSK